MTKKKTHGKLAEEKWNRKQFERLIVEVASVKRTISASLQVLKKPILKKY